MIFSLNLADCLPALKSFSDNQFDLAVVDPDYYNKMLNRLHTHVSQFSISDKELFYV